MSASLKLMTVMQMENALTMMDYFRANAMLSTQIVRVCDGCPNCPAQY